MNAPPVSRRSQPGPSGGSTPPCGRTVDTCGRPRAAWRSPLPPARNGRRRAGGLPAWVLAGLTLLVQAGCGGGEPAEPGPLPKVDRSAAGVVSAAHPLAARAGAEMLELGGTAADAAVAAAFTLAVVEPSMSGLGGRAQVLVRTPLGEHVGIDGTTQAPESYDPDTAPRASLGYPVIGIPGVPAALMELHGRFGTLPRNTVMGPAIRYAEGGFRLLPGEAARHAAMVERLAELPEEEQGAFQGTRDAFLKPDGSSYSAGEIFRQPDLAATLQALERGGAQAFYRGEIARRMAEDIQAHGGAVTGESLAAYRAEESRIVRGNYRGHDLVGLWIPSFGAITIEILELLETVPFDPGDDSEWALALSEAIRVAYLDRREQEDWDDALRLTSADWAAERAGLMRLEGLTAEAGAGTVPVPDGNTTHLTAADRDGMVVALTQSLGPSMGSRVVTPGLGFLYAATLGGYLGRMEPGERARSHISPFLVEREGTPVLALGAAGGGRIPTAVAAVVSRVLDGGLTLAEALQAPRVVPESGSFSSEGDPGTVGPLNVEVNTGLGFAAGELADLEAAGRSVVTVEETGRFGRVHAVRWLPEAGVWEGAADPDWEGGVAVPRGTVR